MLKMIVHWLVFLAVIAHLFSCIFLGQSYMPDAMQETAPALYGLFAAVSL